MKRAECAWDAVWAFLNAVPKEKAQEWAEAWVPDAR